MQSKEGLAESFDAKGGGTSDVSLQLQLSPDGQQPGAVFLNPLSRLQYELVHLLHVTCRRCQEKVKIQNRAEERKITS